jgi:hypothetical protein
MAPYKTMLSNTTISQGGHPSFFFSTPLPGSKLDPQFYENIDFKPVLSKIRQD